MHLFTLTSSNRTANILYKFWKLGYPSMSYQWCKPTIYIRCLYLAKLKIYYRYSLKRWTGIVILYGRINKQLILKYLRKKLQSEMHIKHNHPNHEEQAKLACTEWNDLFWDAKLLQLNSFLLYHKCLKYFSLTRNLKLININLSWLV